MSCRYTNTYTYTKNKNKNSSYLLIYSIYKLNYYSVFSPDFAQLFQLQIAKNKLNERGEREREREKVRGIQVGGPNPQPHNDIGWCVRAA